MTLVTTLAVWLALNHLLLMRFCYLALLREGEPPRAALLIALGAPFTLLRRPPAAAAD